jgi:uncharacterized membrane protein YqgA involved in biofilm formation
MFLTGTILNVATVLIGMIIGVLAPLFLRVADAVRAALT